MPCKKQETADAPAAEVKRPVKIYDSGIRALDGTNLSIPAVRKAIGYIPREMRAWTGISGKDFSGGMIRRLEFTSH